MRRLGHQVGLDPGQVNQQLQAAYGQVDPAVQQQIQQVLSPYFNNADVQSAVAAYNQFGPSAIQSVTDLGNGNVIGAMEAATPLIAAGLAATGVGAPVAGAIMAGLTIFEGVANVLQLTTPSPPLSCHWTVMLPQFGANQSAVCFNGPRPYGPRDPNWLTIEQYAGLGGRSPITWQLMDAYTRKGIPGPQAVETWPSVTFDPWWGLLRQDLNFLGIALPPATSPNSAPPIATYGNPNPPSSLVDEIVQANYGANGSWSGMVPDNLAKFIAAFEQAVVRSLEYPINAWRQPDPLALLEASAAAWNAVHSNGYTYTFNGAGRTYIDALIRGDYNSQSWHPVTINIGQPIQPGPKFHVPPGFAILSDGTVAKGSSLSAAVVVPTALGVGAAWLFSNPILAAVGLGIGLILNHKSKK